ncbi:TolB, C-terminal domain-containing protein, partial [Melanomma pulvis-pyrius CBS 109.77]
GQRIERVGVFSSFDSTQFSKDGSRMLTLDDKVAYVYDLDNATANLTLVGHTNQVVSEVFSPDGKIIATTAWDGYTKIWNATTGQLIKDIGPSGDYNWLVLFSPDNKYLLETGPPKPTVKLWPVSNTNNQTITPIGIGSLPLWARNAVWSPNGEFLAIGSFGQILIVRSSDLKTVQNWQIEAERFAEVSHLTWLDGGKKLAYRVTAGLEMYDFEKNLKYRWGPDDLDHYKDYYTGGQIMVVNNKGWIGGVDGDQMVRFWPYP